MAAADVSYPVPKQWARDALITAERYRSEYMRSIQDPDGFWYEQAFRLDWMRVPTRAGRCSFDLDDLRIEWFAGGRLNAAENCLDRHLAKRANQPAILWEGDDPNESRTITYAQLHAEVCKFANGLRGLGVRRGDRVAIYMPMVPEAVVAMLACARIGAVHSVVFGGFSPAALASRINDCEAKVLVVADEGLRGGRKIPLKTNADTALAFCPSVKHCVVLRRTGGPVELKPGRDLWWHDLVADQPAECEPAIMEAEDPLFILYTSGSTGKPKGVLHTTAGYLVFVSLTHEWVFDYRSGDVYWCTADVGWITGHSYIVYGPLLNGATTVMYEGIPTHPDASRFWQICDKHQVNILYTAPTAIRALMREGDESVRKISRKSLRLLGSVGEPINPEAWLWYYNVVGEKRCPIVDTWWQTETGGILLTPLPGATPLKPGSAAWPFFGVEPVIVDDDGRELAGACSGNLCFRQVGPGMMHTLYNAHAQFADTYFKTYPGLYFTGDGCRRDEDGYYWVTGRVDDVVNVSGHRLGTAEVESALTQHPKVVEAAVVGYPHAVKGQGIHAFVTLRANEAPSTALRQQLAALVRETIGPIATLDHVQWAPALPKTRSGKIMRRILRRIAQGDYASLGDTSTLADAAVIENLVAEHRREHEESSEHA
ncbi:MAG: acetate--CoA ligase [Burkholderiales bacterium]|nr:acetate--CoA ligase [Burkholderiales bacterium]